MWVPHVNPIDHAQLFTEYRKAADLRSLLACVKAFGSAPRPAVASRPAVRLAIAGNYSTQFLAMGFPLALAARDIDASIWESGYNAWQLDLLNPESELYSFTPTHVLLALSSIELSVGSLRTATRVVEAIADVASRVRAQTAAQLLITLPEPLSEETSDQTAAYVWRRDTCARLEATLTDPRVTFIDLEPLLRTVGHQQWFDDRFYDTSKIPFHPDRTPRVLARLADAIAGTVVPRCKLVVVDLDDTLWGGGVGDEGWQGVDLDVSGRGRHHLRLQLFLKGVHERGILLAIASKNDLEPVRDVFDRRPEMILRFDDFVETQIHWKPKSGSIEQILRSLNMTATGVMFLDDSPVERGEVRRQFPDLLIPELPDTPADWVPMLVDTGVFDRRVVTEDSVNRQHLYRDNARRHADRDAVEDIDQFLAGLGMELTVFDVSDHRDRVMELIHKTNQFNVTTRRHSWDDVRAVARHGLALCYRLTDRYGDNGIVSVMLLDREGDGDYRVDLWLMSCRVMGRRVENAIMEDTLRRAAALGGRRVVGEYIATPKNAPVRTLFERLGFEAIADTDAARRYGYCLDHRPFTAATPHIAVIDRVKPSAP